jgi:NAD-dependent SIR2 family protein deacetylase
MPHPRPWPGFDRLADLCAGRSVVVLSGAGLSTESGIPDYRGSETRRKTRAPIRYREFMDAPETRRHYWARSAVGWSSFSAKQPNPGHEALARMEAAGVVRGVITQNVDRLHQAAGSERVIELHGALAEVRCLDCNRVFDRDRLQQRIRRLNPGWADRAATVAPDGDAELPRSVTAAFRVPPCRACGGVLKPHVVFFGESVPPHRVEAAWDLLEGADVLLVTGSSLAVYSGFRFVRGAAAAGQDLGIVNLGPTRGDDLAGVCVEGRTGEVLPGLADALLEAGASPVG